jgi:5'-nucleotidase
MLILLDMDGVLADFEQGFLDAWARKHPDQPTVAPEQRRNFYIDDDYPEHCRPLVEKIFTAQGFYAGLPPIPGALQGVREMLEAGHDVSICTAPHSFVRYCVPEKYEWVERHLGSEFVRRVIVTKDKTLVFGDVLVDDRPNIEGYRIPAWRHVIYDQPYNREVQGLRMDWKGWRGVVESCAG